MQEYSALAYRFYQVEVEHLAPQQYSAAKQDIEYFFEAGGPGDTV